MPGRSAGGDDALAGECHGAERDECDALVVLDADPDQVGAADLGDGGGDEQRDGAGGHVGIVPGRAGEPPSSWRARMAIVPARRATARCSTATTIARTAMPVRDSS